MLYLVDGHNLIPKIPGLSLRAADDEMQLIELLQVFSRVKRKKVEVYFDRAAAGRAGVSRFGVVTAHFVNQNSSADEAIRKRLESLGHTARGFCVVSSDHAVQNSARLNRSQTMSSEDFARELLKAMQTRTSDPYVSGGALTEGEVEEWLRLFNQSRPDRKD